MALSKYQELREAFADYCRTHREYYEQNERLVRSIVNDLPAYLGIGKHFNDYQGKKKRYVSYYKYKNPDERKFVKGASEAIVYSSNTEFTFGIGVILEREPDSFPKTNAILRLTALRQEDVIMLHLDEEEVSCQLDGEVWSNIECVHEMIYRHLQLWLQRRPNDPGTGNVKIGFQVDGTSSMNGVPLTGGR